jgi:hypothetical protein
MAGPDGGTMILGMTPRPTTTRAPRPIASAARLSACCGHVLVPAHPVAAGYRYVDLGGDTAPFYLKRFTLGDRSTAIALRAPIERTSGDEAERGAPALAHCELSIGPRRVGWSELPALELRAGESATLAHRAVAEICELETLQRDECPFCS